MWIRCRSGTRLPDSESTTLPQLLVASLLFTRSSASTVTEALASRAATARPARRHISSHASDLGIANPKDNSTNTARFPSCSIVFGSPSSRHPSLAVGLYIDHPRPISLSLSIHTRHAFGIRCERWGGCQEQKTVNGRFETSEVTRTQHQAEGRSGEAKSQGGRSFDEVRTTHDSQHGAANICPA